MMRASALPSDPSANAEFPLFIRFFYGQFFFNLFIFLVFFKGRIIDQTFQFLAEEDQFICVMLKAVIQFSANGSIYLLLHRHHCILIYQLSLNQDIRCFSGLFLFLLIPWCDKLLHTRDLSLWRSYNQ